MDKILQRLARVKKTKDGYMARCPSHPDRTASLTLSEKNGVILIHCFAGCETKEIVSSLGMTMADLFEDKAEKKEMIATHQVKVKKYKSIDEVKSLFKTLEYCHEYKWQDDKEPSYLQIRYKVNDEKAFATYHKEDNMWVTGKGSGLTPLYNLDGIKDSKAVLIVEGEKVVDLLKYYGIPATTSMGGSNNAENTDWTPLLNKASVVIWRDNDNPGLNYQDSVSKILSNIGVHLRKVEVDKLGLEKGDDLEQYIAKQVGERDQIRGKIYSCLPKLEKIEPVSYLKDHLIKVKKGDIKNWTVEFFPMLTKYARAFKPGTQTVIVSAGGVGKSLFAGRMSDELVLNDKAKVKRLHLESSMSFYLLRSLAQQSKCIDVMEEEFHYHFPEKSDNIVNTHQDVLNIIGDTITTSDSGAKKKLTEWDAEGVMKWMEKNAECDILIIDPVSMVLDGAEPWKISTRLTKHAEELMSRHEKLCIVWIQHTADSASAGNVGAIAGGKAWNRFSSSILELISLDDPDDYEIMDNNGDVLIREVSTYIKVKKARNGKAANWKIAMELDTSDLSYKEIGRMLKKVKK